MIVVVGIIIWWEFICKFFFWGIVVIIVFFVLNVIKDLIYFVLLINLNNGNFVGNFVDILC